MAKVLPIALPPTVSAATVADMVRVMSLGQEKPGMVAITSAAIMADAEPDTTPQISPMTSLQMELTLSALRSSLIASWAPGTFLAAMEWKGFSSAEVTATPIISNTIPTMTMISRIRNATRILLFHIISSERKLMVPEINRVTIKICSTHFLVLLFSFLIASESGFATGSAPFHFIIIVKC